MNRFARQSSARDAGFAGLPSASRPCCMEIRDAYLAKFRKQQQFMQALEAKVHDLTNQLSEKDELIEKQKEQLLASQGAPVAADELKSKLSNLQTQQKNRRLHHLNVKIDGDRPSSGSQTPTGIRTPVLTPISFQGIAGSPGGGKSIGFGNFPGTPKSIPNPNDSPNSPAMDGANVLMSPLPSPPASPKPKKQSPAQEDKTNVALKGLRLQQQAMQDFKETSKKGTAAFLPSMEKTLKSILVLDDVQAWVYDKHTGELSSIPRKSSNTLEVLKSQDPNRFEKVRLDPFWCVEWARCPLQCSEALAEVIQNGMGTVADAGSDTMTNVMKKAKAFTCICNKDKKVSTEHSKPLWSEVGSKSAFVLIVPLKNLEGEVVGLMEGYSSKATSAGVYGSGESVSKSVKELRSPEVISILARTAGACLHQAQLQDQVLRINNRAKAIAIVSNLFNKFFVKFAVTDRLNSAWQAMGPYEHKDFREIAFADAKVKCDVDKDATESTDSLEKAVIKSVSKTIRSLLYCNSVSFLVLEEEEEEEEEPVKVEPENDGRRGSVSVSESAALKRKSSVSEIGLARRKELTAKEEKKEEKERVYIDWSGKPVGRFEAEMASRALAKKGLTSSTSSIAVPLCVVQQRTALNATNKEQFNSFLDSVVGVFIVRDKRDGAHPEISRKFSRDDIEFVQSVMRQTTLFITALHIHGERVKQIMLQRRRIRLMNTALAYPPVLEPFVQPIDPDEEAPIVDISVTKSFPTLHVLHCEVVGPVDRIPNMPSRLGFLSSVIQRMDDVVQEYGAYKVDTGALNPKKYVVVTGLPFMEEASSHGKNHKGVLVKQDAVECLGRVALRLKGVIEDTNERKGSQLEMRFGIHSGPAEVGLFDYAVPKFVIHGEAMDKAAHMCEKGMENMIQTTTTAYRHLKNRFRLKYRGIDIDDVRPYLLSHERDEEDME